MSPPEVVVLDTRGARDKQSFLTACARSLAFPDYFGHNWDALADSLGEFARARSPVLVVWTGASDLAAADRDIAVDIMSERFIDGADLLIVDDVHAAPAPDFALDHVQLAMPPGAEEQACTYWVGVVGLSRTEKPPQLADHGGVWLTGEALDLHIGVDIDFRPATKAHPGILVRDFDALLGRLIEAGYETRPSDEMPGRFHTNDPFGNRIEFIAF